MATVEEIAQLRLMIAEPDETTYTDEMLSSIIDGYAIEDLPLVESAYLIWTQKAASYVELVDISEGGSQRKNGDLHKRALTMADLFKAQLELAADLGRRTRIRRLSRG